MISVYKMILSEEFKAQTKSKRDERKQISDQINQLNTALAKARNLLLNEAIDASDYRLIKIETEDKTQRLEAKLAFCPNDHFSINGLIDKALADIQIDSLNKETVNPLARSLGLFNINTGVVHKGNTHIEGDNFSARASGTVLYNDLKLTVLKKGSDSLKIKAFTSFIANSFLIRKNNPEKGKAVRNATVILQRDHKYGSFFNFVWGIIRKGLLKITVPAKG